jgi:hypothetical protein
MRKKIFYISRDEESEYYSDEIRFWARRPILVNGDWICQENDPYSPIINVDVDHFKPVFKKSCRKGRCQKIEITVLDEFGA